MASPIINRMSTYIKAGKAAAAPPLGPMLGQYGINIMKFCKDFNSKTKIYKPGINIPTVIEVRADKSFSLVLKSPPVSYFLMAAAGIQKGAHQTSHEVAGTISLKHVYEIAQVKLKDPALEHIPIQTMCKNLIGSTKSMGIEVVKEMSPEYTPPEFKPLEKEEE